MENQTMRQAGFAAIKAQSDDKVIWDDNDEDDDNGSSIAPEGSGLTHDDDGATTLHVAAAGGKISLVVDAPDSLERLPAALKLAASKKLGGGMAAPKKRTQLAPLELA
jgi:hypothetical protein